MAPLIDAATLAQRLQTDSMRVLDVQYSLGGPDSRELYAAGHLPMATHLSLDEALAGPPGRDGRHPLPDPGVLEEALRGAGVRGGESVVVYDQGPSLAASRAWWVLRWAGLRDVTVLDGGLAAWVRAGGTITTDPVTAPTGDVVVAAGRLPVAVVKDIPELARTGVLLDVRTAERFRGEVEPIDPVAGHIPGARNLPMATMQRPDGTFKSPAEIRAIAAMVGVHGEQRVTTTCGSGVTAAQMTLALAVAGIDSTPFIGSWSEWITDPGRPVARP